MYAVIDNNVKREVYHRIVAYHEKKHVVKRYYNLITNQNPNISYSVIKCKMKGIKMKPDYYDYYLVPYGKGYIQSGYIELILHDHKTLIHDYEFTVDILKRMMEFDDELTAKELKALNTTIRLMAKKIHQEKENIPTIDLLKQMDNMKNEYLWAVGKFYDETDNSW